jgi:hypothetical protein
MPKYSQELLRKQETQFAFCHDLMNIDVTTKTRVEAVRMHMGVGKQKAQLALVWKFQLGAQSRRQRL